MKKIIFSSLALIALSMLIITSCVKKDFDAPPSTSNYDPGLAVNSTILNLKKKVNKSSNLPILIDSDIVISGIVVADDRSGNLYKHIVIQDASSGIDIGIDARSLYLDYPVGRKVYIKCKGLYIGANNKYVVLGSAPNMDGEPQAIISSNIAKHIIKANYPNPVVPINTTISELLNVDNDNNLKLLGTLIQLDSVQYAGSDRGMPYTNSLTVERYLADCADNTIMVRTSEYANFAKANTPSGRGNFVGIYTRYSSTAQLLLRDTVDAIFNGPLCNGNNTLTSLKEIRDLWKAGITTIPMGTKIQGVVISDKDNGNIVTKNLIIQDGEYGIAIRFSTNNPFVVGEKIEMNVSGLLLSEFNSLLQINGTTAKATRIGVGTVIPKVLTVKNINDSIEVYESTLVKIINPNLTSTTGSLIYSGNVNLGDATGTIIMYTSSFANFYNQTYPTNPTSITGVISQYNINQIQIRNLNDVQ